MRIVFLNAWAGVMFDPLMAWLPDCGADVVCLQEVSRTPGVGGWTEFSDDERKLVNRANLFDDVAGVLPDHQGSFVVNDAGPVTTDDGRTHRQDFGLALFVHQRLPVIGQLAAPVHGLFVDHDRWAIEDRPRLVQGVRVVERDRQRTVTVMHMHGLRSATGKQDTPARLAQAEALADLIERFRGDGELAVVGGDFNLLPDSATFDVLGRLGLTDLVGTADTRTARYTKPIRHANYLLVSDTSAVKNFDAPAQPEVSDHRPLVLDL